MSSRREPARSRSASPRREADYRHNTRDEESDRERSTKKLSHKKYKSKSKRHRSERAQSDSEYLGTNKSNVQGIQ